jgi:hypothetical protein
MKRRMFLAALIPFVISACVPLGAGVRGPYPRDREALAEFHRRAHRRAIERHREIHRRFMKRARERRRKRQRRARLRRARMRRTRRFP